MLSHVGALIGSRYRRIAIGAAMIVQTWAGGNVSQACKMMAIVATAFIASKELYDKGGELALQEISRKVFKDRVPQDIEDAVVTLAIGQGLDAFTSSGPSTKLVGATAA
jgi:hypothetical protein